MQRLQEGLLRFSFPDNWVVIKYDTSNFYRNRVEKLDGTKGVDFVAFSGKELFLIEVKDFRDYRIETKSRLEKGELALEFAYKLRDTIAGLYGAYSFQTEDFMVLCREMCAAPCLPLKGILWLEESAPQHKHRYKSINRDKLRIKLKKNIRFMNIRCNIYSSSDLPRDLPWQVETCRPQETAP